MRRRLWYFWARLLPRSLYPWLLPYWRYMAGFVEAWVDSEPTERGPLIIGAFGHPRSKYVKGMRLAGGLLPAFYLVLGKDWVPPEGVKSRFAVLPECPEPTLRDVAASALGACTAMQITPPEEV